MLRGLLIAANGLAALVLIGILFAFRHSGMDWEGAAILIGCAGFAVLNTVYMLHAEKVHVPIPQPIRLLRAWMNKKERELSS